MIKKRKENADNVVAATAGLDTWKTWAGRQHGSDDFEYLDLIRGMRRSFHLRFLAAPPLPGTACPVCFCEPDQSEWFLTSSCGHAVCLDCFKAYAVSQVKDKEQSGPLKCPVCPQALRRSDAIAALSGDKDLLRAWDTKIRNQLLRALPAYRSCPRCSEDSNNESTTGGGFVTPSCLSPHYNERRDDALNRIKQGALGTLFLISVVYFVMARYISRNPSRSVTLDMLSMIIPFGVLFGKVGRAAEHYVAGWARNALFRPITVECPCCNFEFILPASSATIEDQETKAWMENNTRLCPSCSAPIAKQGGCNHMQCSHCRAKFCWACMRLRTSCRAYQCVNGGVDAEPLSRGQQAAQSNDSVLGRIDRILERDPTKLRMCDGVIISLALFCRNLAPVQGLVSWFVAIFSLFFTTEFLSLCMLIFSLKTMLRSRNGQGNREQTRNAQEGNGALEEREEAMVALAIQRSLAEQ